MPRNPDLKELLKGSAETFMNIAPFAGGPALGAPFLKAAGIALPSAGVLWGALEGLAPASTAPGTITSALEKAEQYGYDISMPDGQLPQPAQSAPPRTLQAAKDELFLALALHHLAP